MAELINLHGIRKTKVYDVRRSATERNCKMLYRFTRENVSWLANYFIGQYEERRGKALSSEEKMRVFLRYIGDPGFQSGVAEDVGIHQTSVSKIVGYVTTRITEKANVWIKFPCTQQELEDAKTAWQDKYRFICAIGALDCTHIPIKKPFVHGDEYINRKGVATLNVQATCNSKELFTSVDCSWPGSVHDSRIWRNSAPFRVMKENTCGALILGDQGYGLAPWLMTPFRTLQTEEQQAFNKLHKRERCIIERCFGQVKQRFPILQHKIRLALDKTPSVVLSCFVLHNVAKYLQDEDFPIENLPLNEIGEEVEEEGNVQGRGVARRLEIARIIHENYNI